MNKSSLFQKNSVFLLLQFCAYFAGGGRGLMDVSQLQRFNVREVVMPQSVDELRDAVVNAQWPVSISGARYSQGGQIACCNGIVLDLRDINDVSVDVYNKTVTAQAGAIWRDVQHVIDPHNLSVAVMQSYNDFSIGGSLSVNVHGRDLRYGPLVQTVQSIRVMLADGTIIKADREHNTDLFGAAIGGYGGIGIIVEATFKLTDNVKLERIAQSMDISEYVKHFFNDVLPSDSARFHNANLYPNELQNVLSVTYHKTDKQLTEQKRMQPAQRWHWLMMLQEQLLRRVPKAKSFRQWLEKKQMDKTSVMWRNYEMSYTTNTLEPLTRAISTSVLQEYFVPVDQLEVFVDRLRAIVAEYRVNLLNVSLRYVPQDTDTILPYARAKESFALVLYINMYNADPDVSRAERWTQKLIDAVLASGGTYYLPYQMHATQQQMWKAYPGIEQYREIKKKYDPIGRFSNELLRTYL